MSNDKYGKVLYFEPARAKRIAIYRRSSLFYKTLLYTSVAMNLILLVILFKR